MPPTAAGPSRSMNWIRFFGNFAGRIPRKTFWLANIATFVIEVILAAVAGAIVAQFVGDAAGDLAADVIIFVFLYPSFVIALKRAHDRDIPGWIIGVYYAVLAVYQLLIFAGWSNINPDPSVFSLRPLLFIILMAFVGIISLAVLVELGFRPGAPGPNRYGPDPLEKT
jgi:uncharacterized membrane protein YhaH (DUF805 family)